MSYYIDLLIVPEKKENNTTSSNNNNKKKQERNNANNLRLVPILESLPSTIRASFSSLPVPFVEK
jgi:hypothetical protein